MFASGFLIRMRHRQQQLLVSTAPPPHHSTAGLECGVDVTYSTSWSVEDLWSTRHVTLSLSLWLINNNALLYTAARRHLWAELFYSRSVQGLLSFCDYVDYHITLYIKFLLHYTFGTFCFGIMPKSYKFIRGRDQMKAPRSTMYICTVRVHICKYRSLK